MPRITPLSAFSDNYIWILENAGETWAVDPGDASPVVSYLQRTRRRLNGILITHHHADHIGGVARLARPGMRILGPETDVLPQTTEPLAGGEALRIAGLDVRVLAVPGHTLNHIAFLIESENTDPLLFCGDTLFVAGCGRLFEGTPEQMFTSLSQIMQLPDATKVYCAHEYTLANLQFAQQVEPENDNIREFMQKVKNMRAANRPSVPSTLGMEKRVNPFLRTHINDIRSRITQRVGHECSSGAERFAVLRRWKDQF